MASEQKDTNQQHEEHAANLAQVDAAHREAHDYWGYLFKKDKCGTPLLDRLLKGIAAVIVSRGMYTRGDSHADPHGYRARSLNPATRLI